MSSTAPAGTVAPRRARATSDDRTVVLRPRPDEAESYDVLMRNINAVLGDQGIGRLVGPDATQDVVVPASLMTALRRAVEAVARGRMVTIAPQHLEMTSQQAADFLHVSRPHLIKLLDQGQIPYHRTSEHPAAHRRVVLQAVLEYSDRRRAVRREALEELTAVAEEADGDYY